MKKYIFILFLAIFSLHFNNLYSQWSTTWFDGVFPVVKSYGNTIYVLYTIGSGLFKSTNEGLTWKQINRKPINFNYWPQSYMTNCHFYTNDTIILLPEYWGSGAIISTDFGNNWKIVNYGMINKNGRHSEKVGNYYFMGGWQAMYRSSNYGEQWDSVSNGLPPVYDVQSFFSKDNNLYAGVATNSSLPNGIYRTTNYGMNWVFIGPSNEPSGYYTMLYADSSYIFTSTGNLYRTSNYGTNWITLTNGLNGQSVGPVYKFGQYLFCGTGSGINDVIYRSTNYGNNWISKYNGIPYYSSRCGSLAGTNNQLFANVRSSLPGGGDIHEIYNSSDFGESWRICDSAIKNINFTSFTNKGDSVYVSTIGFGVYNRDNVNNYFAPINRDNLNFNIRTLLINGNLLYAGCDSGKIFQTTDNGNIWVSLNNGLPNKDIRALCKNINYYFAGTDGNGIYRTSDFSLWTSVNSGLTKLNIRSLFSSDNYVYAGTDSGLFRSSNNGSIWQKITNGIPDLVINSIAVSNQLVVIGADSTGVYYSENGSNTFSRAGTLKTIKAVGITTTYIYVGSNDSKIYVCNKSGINDIKRNEWSGIPNSIMLFQNYPNPFNPKTTIKFSILKDEFVTLKIYDILGKEIKTLVNDNLSAGYYTVDWEATEYSSGIYFYRINVGDIKKVKRMVLLK